MTKKTNLTSTEIMIISVVIPLALYFILGALGIENSLAVMLVKMTMVIVITLGMIFLLIALNMPDAVALALNIDLLVLAEFIAVLGSIALAAEATTIELKQLTLPALFPLLLGAFALLLLSTLAATKRQEKFVMNFFFMRTFLCLSTAGCYLIFTQNYFWGPVMMGSAIMLALFGFHLDCIAQRKNSTT